MADFDAVLDDDALKDDVLRLVFIACHPVLPTESRVALTLRLLGGLTTEEIARAFLVPEATVAQRIVRAKRTLADKRDPVRDSAAGASGPTGWRRCSRCIYLIFNEGYTATAGDDWLRPELCHEALRLGRMLAELDADRAGGARSGRADGDPGLAGTRPGSAPGGEPDPPAGAEPRPLGSAAHPPRATRRCCAPGAGHPVGPYVLQAAIAACHARARTADGHRLGPRSRRSTDAARLTPSPVVELNRAVAVAMAYGPAARAGDRRRARRPNPALRDYHLLPTVRGDLLASSAAPTRPAAEYQRAASLTQNAQERAVLLRRADAFPATG